MTSYAHEGEIYYRKTVKLSRHGGILGTQGRTLIKITNVEISFKTPYSSSRACQNPANISKLSEHVRRKFDSHRDYHLLCLFVHT